MTHEKWGVRPEQFPFQTLVNSSDYQSYICFLLQRKSQKQGRRSYQKIIHIYPKKRRKTEAIVNVLSSKKISSSIYSFLEYHLRTLLEKIYWEAYRIPWRNETHSDLLLNSHGRLFIFFCTNQSGLLNSLRAFFIGKFAILEFTPASSPFLSSHRQVRHSWVHTGKFAILEFTPAS